jgi:phosphosulfolactate phosphohydrolase-like enzyme
MARDLFLYHQTNIISAVAGSEHGLYLPEVGFSDDVEYCSRLDICSTIPVYDKFEKKIVKLV